MCDRDHQIKYVRSMDAAIVCDRYSKTGWEVGKADFRLEQWNRSALNWGYRSCYITPDGEMQEGRFHATAIWTPTAGLMAESLVPVEATKRFLENFAPFEGMSNFVFFVRNFPDGIEQMLDDTFLTMLEPHETALLHCEACYEDELLLRMIRLVQTEREPYR